MVEAVTVGYVKESDDISEPDQCSWKYSIVHMWASWSSETNPLTVRNLVRSQYPEAVYLQDLVHQEITSEDSGKTQDVSTQTTSRIYTFPVPLQQQLARESVTWGTPYIREELIHRGELWHARHGHCNDEIMSCMALYSLFNVPKHVK